MWDYRANLNFWGIAIQMSQHYLLIKPSFPPTDLRCHLYLLPHFTNILVFLGSVPLVYLWSMSQYFELLIDWYMNEWVKWVKVTQCPTLCNHMDWILQARILEWVAFPFSRGSSQPREQTQVSCIAGGATKEVQEYWSG